LSVPFVGASSGKGADSAPWRLMRVDAGLARGIDRCWSTPPAGCTRTSACVKSSRRCARGGKRQTGAPHESLLVLDATVGQNAVHQAREFSAAVPLTGL